MQNSNTLLKENNLLQYKRGKNLFKTSTLGHPTPHVAVTQGQKWYREWQFYKMATNKGNHRSNKE